MDKMALGSILRFIVFLHALSFSVGTDISNDDELAISLNEFSLDIYKNIVTSVKGNIMVLAIQYYYSVRNVRSWCKRYDNASDVKRFPFGKL